MHPTSPFEELARSFYRRQWERRPSSGSRAGLVEYDERLEIPTRDLVEDELADLRGTRAELSRLPAPERGGIDWLDHQSLGAYLDLEELFLAEIQHWRTNPVDPVELAVGSIFGLLVRRDVDVPETAEAVRKRLLALPVFLRESRQRMDRPVRLWVLAARPAAAGGVEFLRSAVPNLAARHPRLATGLERASQAAAAALREYDDWLGALSTKPLAQDPAVGEEALTRIIRTSHGLPYSLEELDALAGREIARLEREMRELSLSIDPERSWTEIIERERQAFAAQPHDLLREYREATQGLRERLVADAVLDMPPGETCEVISTPAFLRSVISSAAYCSPGPLDSIQRGIYYVSDPPSSLPPEEYRANVGQHFGFESTCAHEAYPGHHVQLCWANHASSLARQMAHHIIFMEGWTLYCEQLVLDLGYLRGPLWELDCLASQLWRAHRIRIDIGVHTHAMSIEEAIRTLERELGFTPLRAQTELNWYTQSPGTPMSYLLGKHETAQLARLYRERHPGSSLRQFHSWLLHFGSVPQRWLHDLVDHDPSERPSPASDPKPHPAR